MPLRMHAANDALRAPRRLQRRRAPQHGGRLPARGGSPSQLFRALQAQPQQDVGPKRHDSSEDVVRHAERCGRFEQRARFLDAGQLERGTAPPRSTPSREHRVIGATRDAQPAGACLLVIGELGGESRHLRIERERVRRLEIQAVHEPRELHEPFVAKKAPTPRTGDPQRQLRGREGRERRCRSASSWSWRFSPAESSSQPARRRWRR